MSNENENESLNPIETENISLEPDNTLNESDSPDTNLFQEPVDSDAAHPGNTPKKKAPKWLIPVCAVGVLVIVAVVAVFCSPALSNTLALATMKPNAYYQKVETANLTSKINFLTKDYDSAYKKSMDLIKKGIGQESTFTAKIDPSLTGMIGLSDLESFGFKTASMAKNMNTKAVSSVIINDTEVLSLSTYLDMNSGLLYYLVPSLNKAYLKMSLEDMNAAYEEISVSTMDLKEIYGFLLNNPFTEKFLNNTLKKYTQVVTDNFNTVTMKKNVSENTNGIVGKYTELTVSFTNKELYSIIEQLLTTAIADKELSGICEKAKLFTAEEYKTNLEQALSDFKANKENFLSSEQNTSMKVFVNNKGIIMGREFSITADEITSILGYRSEKEKSDSVFEMWAADSDMEIFNITSRVTEKSNKYAGNMNIVFTDPTSNTANTTAIAMENLSPDDLKEGYINGKFTITNSALGIFNFVINLDGEQKKQDVTIDCIQGTTNLVSLAATTILTDYEDFEFPTDAEESYDGLTEMEDYLASSDFERFLTELKEKVNLEMFSYYLDSYFY